MNALRYDQEDGTYYCDLDAAPFESVSTVIIEAILELSGASRGELDPLFDQLDPDALDSLCGSFSPAADGEVRFRYEGHTIVVESGNRVQITPPVEAADPHATLEGTPDGTVGSRSEKAGR